MPIKSKVVSIARKKDIPAIVIDVLGEKCTVKLSDSTGKIIRNIYFFGSVPTKGARVYIDFSKGDPVAMVRPTPTNAVSSGVNTGNPFITAQVASTQIKTEVPDSTKYGNVYYRGEWDAAIEYLENDIVLCNHSFYMCIQEVVGMSVSNETYWKIFGARDDIIWTPVSYFRDFELVRFFIDGPLAAYENIFSTIINEDIEISKIVATCEDIGVSGGIQISIRADLELITNPSLSITDSSSMFSETTQDLDNRIFSAGKQLTVSIDSVTGYVNCLEVIIFKKEQEILYGDNGVIVAQEEI